jgi:hypothetical protein
MTKYIKPIKINPNFTIVYDHREVGRGKRPWTFLEQHYGAMKKKHLRTGDYSILGCESRFGLERKSGILELLADLNGRYRPTFKRFLKRLSSFDHKYIVVEEPLTHSKVQHCVQLLKTNSRGRSQLTENTVYWWIGEIGLTYNIPIIFTDMVTGQELILRIFERANELLQRGI